MLPSPDVVRDDFDRIARHSRGLPDRLGSDVERLIERVPPGRTRVLDVGCGTGALARRLAAGGARVTAIDLSPRMIEVAFVRTPDTLPVNYQVADVMTLDLHGFDVAISVATLHHLPLAAALARLAAAVVPGGLVLVSDLFTAPGLRGLPYNAVSWLARGGFRRSSHSAELHAAWSAHDAHDAILRFDEVERIGAAALPGALVRRHLGWRYTLAWTRPR